jgi:hypothetical protein
MKPLAQAPQRSVRTSLLLGGLLLLRVRAR